MPTATTLRPGTIIRVRPYLHRDDGHGGRSVYRGGYRQAIVLGEFMDYPTLWFFTLGDPAVGDIIQPLYRDMEYRDAGKRVADLPQEVHRRLDRSIGRSTVGGPVGEHLHAIRMEINRLLAHAKQAANDQEAR